MKTFMKGFMLPTDIQPDKKMRRPGETRYRISVVCLEARMWAATFTSVETSVAYCQNQNLKRMHVRNRDEDKNENESGNEW